MAEAAQNKNAPKEAEGSQKLKKELGLFDVYVISTGAMFSSGFFLLPGIATVYGGPATVLAYLLAGMLIIPAMFSMAELSTALPRAGGTYYFIDRSLGPMAGTVGGMGTWLALVLKSAFALIGMGAYLAIAPYIGHYFQDWVIGEWVLDSEWIIKALAVILTVLFMLINLFGAKETTKLQGILVVALLGVLAFFVVQGLWYLWRDVPLEQVQQRYTPFLHEEKGWGGMLSTIGLVFVSYAGLTKVASVSEEVKRPDRNLPLAMILSLITATVIYVVGVFIIIALVDSGELRNDKTPVFTAAKEFFNWFPFQIGLILIVIAALAAFASTGNAGILAASRYPLAMARDRLVPEHFGRLSGFGTPTWGILATSLVIILFIVFFPIESVAKLASAFNLLVFGIICISVIVMRESKIESYDPGFRSPLYPWMQIAGVIISAWLILEMGPLAILFSVGVIGLGLLWYFYYARGRARREGAIYHIFERLGHKRHDPLDAEFREILKEKGARATDPFDDVIARATVFDAGDEMGFVGAVDVAAKQFAARHPVEAEMIRRRFIESGKFGDTPMAHGAALPHFRTDEIDQPDMVIVRSRRGFITTLPDSGDDTSTGRSRDDANKTETRKADGKEGKGDPPVERRRPRQSGKIHAVFFLLSPEDNPGRHLRILAQLAGRLEGENFMDEWLAAKDEQAMKEVLLRDEQFLALHLREGTSTDELIGQNVVDLGLPQGVLIAMIRRHGRVFVPHGQTRLQTDDRLTLIGDPKGIRQLQTQYLKATASEPKPQSPGKSPEDEVKKPTVSEEIVKDAEVADRVEKREEEKG